MMMEKESDPHHAPLGSPDALETNGDFGLLFATLERTLEPLDPTLAETFDVRVKQELFEIIATLATAPENERRFLLDTLERTLASIQPGDGFEAQAKEDASKVIGQLRRCDSVA